MFTLSGAEGPRPPFFPFGAEKISFPAFFACGNGIVQLYRRGPVASGFLRGR